MAPPSSQTLPGSIPASQVRKTTELPSRDFSAFRTIVKLYEEKRYKKALKAADLLLKKYPNHGESNAMKGLILYHIPSGQNDALESAKKGLACDLSSMTCWHVLGIIYRSTKDYLEAAKCLKQAALLDKDKLTLWKDLASCQIQTRQIRPFLETRRVLFSVRPGFKAHWTTYAFAWHMCGQHGLALPLLRSAIRQFSRHPQGTPLSTIFKAMTSEEERVETGDLLLYETSVLEEAGRWSEAVARLEAIEGVPDETQRLDCLARMHYFLGDLDASHAVYSRLVKLHGGDLRYVICHFATHPSTRSYAVPPIRPKSCPSSGDETNEKSVATDKATDVGNDNPISPVSAAAAAAAAASEASTESATSKKEFLHLSPYLLDSPLLWSCRMRGWTSPPSSVLYDSQRSGAITAEMVDTSLLFALSRKLTEDEERCVSCWFLEFFPQLIRPASYDVALGFILRLVSGSRFVFYADQFLRHRIRKGAPFVIRLLRRITASDTSKAALILELVRGYVEALSSTPSTCGARPPPPPEVKLDESGSCLCPDCPSGPAPPVESPGVLLTARAVLAQALNELGEQDEALQVITQAIEGANTVVELYQIKSRIYKHQGLLKEAAATHEEARSLDLADRYINTKSVKRLLAIGEVEKASDVARIFSRQSADSDGLYGIQCMWYELRLGEAYRKKGDVELAAAQFHKIVRHFNEIRLDEFDFHQYCPRRGGFRTYLAFLRMQDVLCSHKYYRTAAKRLTGLYLDMADRKANGDSVGSCPKDKEPGSEPGGSKKKKKKSAASPAPPAKSATTAPAAPLTSEGFRALDLLEGKNLLSHPEPIPKAAEFANVLLSQAPLAARSQILGYEVFWRQRKYLQMARSVFRLWHLTSSGISDTADLPLKHLFSPKFCSVFAHMLLLGLPTLVVEWQTMQASAESEIAPELQSKINRTGTLLDAILGMMRQLIRNIQVNDSVVDVDTQQLEEALLSKDAMAVKGAGSRFVDCALHFYGRNGFVGCPLKYRKAGMRCVRLLETSGLKCNSEIQNLWLRESTLHEQSKASHQKANEESACV